MGRKFNDQSVSSYVLSKTEAVSTLTCDGEGDDMVYSIGKAYSSPRGGRESRNE